MGSSKDISRIINLVTVEIVLFLTLMCKNLKGLETCLQRGSKIQNNAIVQNKLLR